MNNIEQIAKSDYIVAYGRDPSKKLSSGMTVEEAMFRASKWWGRIGRNIFRDMKAHQKKENDGEFSSDNPDSENFLSSGILNAKPWVRLTDRERIEIMIKWHTSFIVVADLTNLKSPTYEMGKGFIKYSENN